jgi:hypothetical protein
VDHSVPHGLHQVAAYGLDRVDLPYGPVGGDEVELQAGGAGVDDED